MTPLDIFPAAPRWVAWRNENRGRRLTKVPYGRNGHGAKPTIQPPGSPKDQATALEQRISNGHGGGIGYELGDVGSDTHLCGIDLDSCLDQDRKIAPWASVIVAAVSTYSEISPSGRGLKSFFYCATEDVRRFLELAGVADPNQWGLSRSNPGERPKTDHGPGIEIYMARRYFAVTGNQWPSQPDKVSLLDWPALERYAGLIPPAKSNGNGADKSANDNSRSAVAFRKGAALRRAANPSTRWSTLCRQIG
jgi:putative DNA primase/helicase